MNTLYRCMDVAPLSKQEMRTALSTLFSSKNPIQNAALLTLLSMRNEKSAILLELVQFMQSKMRGIQLDAEVLDIVGTGGDGHHTVNISTGAALLAASCGVKIAKHGNRSASSLCGSADVLEALGVDIHDIQVSPCLEATNFGFCFAPYFHPLLSPLKTLRQALKVPTLLNLVGPLLNPACAAYRIVGVAKPKDISLVAEVLSHMSIKHALVMHGQGLDEVSPLGEACGMEVREGRLTSFTLSPQEYGIAPCTLADLKGGTAEENACILKQALQGERNAVADAFILNAGLAVYLYGLRHTIAEGIDLAKQKQREGAGYRVLMQVQSFYREER